MTAKTRIRNGFTLVELLVVIAIIAILASLTGAAVQKVRERGRDVQCRSDITQLGAAISQFKARFGVYPPCFGSGTNGTFILRTKYDTMSPSAPEIVLLRQMFPRMSLADNGLRKNAAIYNGGSTEIASKGVGQGTSSPDALLDPNQALIVFLSGGTYTDYQGFSTDPERPFKSAGGVAGARLNGGAFWEGFANGSRRITPAEYFTTIGGSDSRFASDNADSLQQPWFVDPWGTPYLYFTSNQGNDYPFDPAFTHTTPLVQTAGRTAFAINPWTRDSDTSEALRIQPFRENNTRLVEMRGFQIISAGRNRFFGPGGVRVPGVGRYTINSNDTLRNYGGDDYANFQQTPLAVTD